MRREMAMKDFQVIQSVDQLRSLAREQRLQILKSLIESPLTATMVAERIGSPVNKVHYHVQQLVKQSLVVGVADPPGAKRGERYYRAVARQFLVDPALTGSDDSVSRSLHESLEVSMLQWRRRKVLDLDLGRITRRIVVDCLHVEPDQKVLVMFAPTAIDLAETLLVELQAAGAETRTRVWSRNVILQTIDRHTPESLAGLSFSHPGQDRDLDAMVLVVSSIPQGEPPTPEQREKLPLLMDAVSEWQRSLRERRVRTVEIALPHRGEFEGGWTTPEEAIDVYWRCLDAPADSLRAIGDKLRRVIGDGQHWTVSDARGTALELEIQSGSVHANDGAISADDIANGLPDAVLPAGQLFGLPTAGSVSGSVWADYAYLAGRHYYDVRLDICHDRIVDAKAREGTESLVDGIRRETGDSDLLSGIGIGLNPGGRALTGKPSLDAILSGVVTICFGNNELEGGSVRSTLTLNLPSRSMTVTAGNRPLVTGGILVSDVS